MNMVYRMLEDLYFEFKEKDRRGALANYIPELTKVPATNFGIVLTTVDGYQYAFGDTEESFTIQSVSKPFVYGMAIQEHGVETVLQKISVEPSGDAFNSISLYPDSGRPFNPMINAGAIAATGLVWQVYRNHTFDRILETFSTYAGTSLQVDESVYSSESETGHRNRAIAHLLRNFNILESDVEPPLDAYFRQCSIMVTCRQLSVMGATLAANGINPFTGKKALKSRFIPSVLSVMATCGMYDYSGEWIYNVGLPAKSGVGGGVMAVLPGQFSIAVYSPLLDEKGNSVLGVNICERIAAAFSLHLYKTPRQLKQVVRRQISLAGTRSKYKRDERAEAILEQFGATVQIMELQGELCFATCEIFMRKIPSDCTALVLNLKKCITMDGGAMRLINMLHDKLRQTEKSLFITNYEHLERLRSLRIKENPCFLKIPEFEDALLHLENIILSANGYRPGKEPIGLGQQQLLRGLSAEELALLSGFVKHTTYQPGELIVKKGSHAEEIFFIESGQAIVQDCVDGNKEFTLAIISAGNSFGEMALLDKEKRSANVLAHTELTCFVMVYDVLNSEPALAPVKVKMLTNIAASLSYRLRAANNELASFT